MDCVTAEIAAPVVARKSTCPVYALRVQGEAYAPAYQHGSYILIKAGVSILMGKNIVLKFTDGSLEVVKLIDRFPERLVVAPVSGGNPYAVESFHAVVGTCGPETKMEDVPWE